MRSFVQKLFFYEWLIVFKRYIRFLNDLVKFSKLSNISLIELWKTRYPCINDRTATTEFDPHYVYHTAWAARIVKEINPSVHYDFSSYLYFSTLVSAFVPVKFFDFRPANIALSDLECGSVNLSSLPFPSESISSMSCMHVVEHIGLGRYGDNINPAGDLEAIRELSRVLSYNGDLLFVVPVAKEPSTAYNAHRIYSYEQVISLFKDLHIHSFSLVSDITNEIIENPSTNILHQQKYGCGCFWFKKIKEKN